MKTSAHPSDPRPPCGTLGCYWRGRAVSKAYGYPLCDNCDQRRRDFVAVAIARLVEGQ